MNRRAYKYIHALLSSGHGDSTGVFSCLDLLYLHSMTRSEPVHLWYIVADYIRYQRQYHCMGMLFAGTHITCLIRRMGLVEAVRWMEKVSSPTPFGLAIIQDMGMIRRRGTYGYALITDVEEKFEEKGDAPEDSHAAPVTLHQLRYP